MSELLIRRLEDCRRRLAKLEEIHIENPVYSGWLSWEAPRAKELDAREVVWGLVRQRCFFYWTGDFYTGSNYYIFFLAPSRAHDTDTRAATEIQHEVLREIARGLSSLCEELPPKARDWLRLPDRAPWWRILHHLAWHFQKPNYLDAVRTRLLQFPELGVSPLPEKEVQLYFANPVDQYPGLVFSLAANNLYSMSVAAIDLIGDVVRQETETPTELAVNHARYAQMRDELRVAGWSLERHAASGQEFKVIKVADSFSTPPATEWAGYTEGGFSEERINLSALEANWEFAWLRGGCTMQLRKFGNEAGRLLPRADGYEPVMFFRQEFEEEGVRIAHTDRAPVTNRDELGRWVGHVLSTLRKNRPGLVDITWCSKMECHVQFGYTTLRVNLYEAFALTIELSGLDGGIPPRFIGISDDGFLLTHPAPEARPVKSGRKKLSARREDQLKANLYRLINGLKIKGERRKDLLERLRQNRQIAELADEVKVRIDEDLIRAAYVDGQRKPTQN